MKPILFVFIVTLLSLFSCQSSTEGEVSFYHWKNKARWSEEKEKALQVTECRKIYLRYFDVDVFEEESRNRGIYPVYVLREVDSSYRNYEIIPTVFITNRTLTRGLSTWELSRNIRRLIEEISQHHFRKSPKEIQLDCDWTQSTREAYFALVKDLKSSYTVSTTIRLHQIKYVEETGIPPADKGVLMLYNMGELQKEDENSIISSKITSAYINENTRYAMPLEVALPLFSQTVLINKQGHVKLINRIEPDVLQQETTYFSEVGPNLFEVQRDTLYHGYYLSKGFKLKLEESSTDELVESYKQIKSSKLNTTGVVFYHLDDDILKQYNLKKLLRAL